MSRMRFTLPFIGGAALFAAALASPLGAHAGTPSPITVIAGGAAQSYSATLGPVEPDPAGPPAPVCGGDNAGCDQESVTLSAGSFTDPKYTLALAVTPTYTSAGSTGNCLDVTIEDSAGTALNASTCIAGGTTITATKLKAGTYTVEIDADATTLPSAPQPFTASVLASATDTSTGGGGGTSGGGSSSGPPRATFTHEVSVEAQRGVGEPNIAIGSGGQDMYSAGPWGFSTTVSMAWKSSDAGTRWTNLHGGCPANPLRADCSRGGGDAEFQVSDPASIGNPQRVQYEDLNGLDTISCSYSDNGADTFADVTSGNATAGTACNETSTSNQNASDTVAPGTDRPWVAVWPQADQPGGTSDKIFQIFDTGETPGGDAAIYSNDNGATWNLGCQSTGTSCLGGSTGDGVRPGPLVINPTLLQTVSGITYPTLYEFMGTNSNGTQVNISCDGGQTWSNIITSAGGVGTTTTDFVVGALDSAGNVYSAWSTQDGTSPWITYYAHSVGSAIPTGSNCSTAVPGGAIATPTSTDWSAPAAISGAGTTVSNATNINYAVMPWITAGDPGRVDIVYYGTTAASGLNPGTTSATWYLHMAQTTNGLATAPGFTDVLATEQPMHNNSICFSGIGCQLQVPTPGDRNLSDFFEVKADPEGRAVIVFTDDNNSATDPIANNGIGLVSSVQQATGPSLYAAVGNVPPLSSKFLGQSTDVRNASATGGCNTQAATVCAPAGDAQLAELGHNLNGVQVPAADLTKLQVIQKDPTTLEFLMTVNNMSTGPSCVTPGPQCAVVNTGAAGTFAQHTDALWLVTWRWNNDVYFAEATSDPTGQSTNFIAGRPLSVYNDSEPKALEYTAAGNPNATAVQGAFSTANNTVEIDVPMSAVGNPVGTQSELYGLTGWTGDGTTPITPGAASPTVPDSTFSGSIAFFDNIDETAPLDVVVGQPAANTPETPSVPLFVALAGAAGLSGVYLRRRRRRRAPA